MSGLSPHISNMIRKSSILEHMSLFYQVFLLHHLLMTFPIFFTNSKFWNVSEIFSQNLFFAKTKLLTVIDPHEID